MLTRAMVSILQRSENPRTVRTVTRALEKWTGIQTKEIIGSFDTVSVSDWYARNGYRLLSGTFLGGYSSYSGKTITRDSALESSAVYGGVKIIAEDLGKLPFFIYSRSKDGLSTDKATDHPLYPILHDLWNPEVSSGEGVEALTAHALLTGNGYAHIQRVDNKIVALSPWQPEQVQMKRNAQGMLFYEHQEKGQWVPYSRTDVFHLRGFTLDGINGDNMIARACHVLGLTLATQEYPARYFAQGSMLDVILERPLGAPPITSGETVQNIKDAWKKWHQGLRNAHEPAVLVEGMTAKMLAPKHSENQLIEQRAFQVLEVCRLLRLPPHKLADLTKSAYASIDAENTAYIQMTISGWTDRWRRAAHRCLLTPDEQRARRLYAEQNVEALQRGDFRAQAEGWRMLLEKGTLSINEVRRWLNLNPIPGGDEHFIQLNMGTVAEIAAGANLPNAIVPVKPKAPPMQGG